MNSMFKCEKSTTSLNVACNTHISFFTFKFKITNTLNNNYEQINKYVYNNNRCHSATQASFPASAAAAPPPNAP